MPEGGGLILKWRSCFNFMYIIATTEWKRAKSTACLLDKKQIFIIYFDLTRSLKRRERVADCYPFQTSVFGTKIQLTLQLITLARFEGTARVKF